VTISPIELAEAEYNCLMAGTPVVLADGSTALIENLVRQRRQVDVLAWDPIKGICAKPIIDWHKTRVHDQKWTQIKTNACHGGHRGLIVTPDHQVFLKGGIKCAAGDLKKDDEILIPEIRFNEDQRQALLGTLLGDSRLCVSPAHRLNTLQAPNAYIDGGHIAKDGWAQYKVSALAPHGLTMPIQGRTSRKFQGSVCEAEPFQPFRTNNLRQLRDLMPSIYNEDGLRQLCTDTFEDMGAIGLAWWFMDDGCRQNRPGKMATVTLAMCRYNADEIAKVKVWFGAKFGNVWVGADHVLRFGVDATIAFCAYIAPYVIPSLRYKLPQEYVWPDFVDIAKNSNTVATWAKVTEVNDYQPTKNTRSALLKAETRFCITIQDTHNFFTSFGLVKNCRDVLATCRVYSPLLEALERNNVVNVYEVDEQMADLAIQMTRAGMPVNEEKRAAIGERLRTLRDSAIETLKVYTEGEHLEEFVNWAARFMAVKARKGEPTAGALRIGPTQAATALDDLRAMRKEWGDFKRRNQGRGRDATANCGSRGCRGTACRNSRANR
jgi:hypothetical protein